MSRLDSTIYSDDEMSNTGSVGNKIAVIDDKVMTGESMRFRTPFTPKGKDANNNAAAKALDLNLN